MPTAGEVLFNAGYQYAFARFKESESPTHFEARPFNPAVRLTADPFREPELWDEQTRGRYSFSQKEVNGDKVLERLGSFNPRDPNPIWKAWCDAHGVEITWEAFMDTKYVARRQKMDDGEDYGTAWDLWISKTVPGDGGPIISTSEELERLREKVKGLEIQITRQREVHEQAEAARDGEKKAIRAALAKVKIKESGGGVPMGVLREIKAVVG